MGFSNPCRILRTRAKPGFGNSSLFVICENRHQNEKNMQKRRKRSDKMLEIFIKIKNNVPKSKSPTRKQIKKLALRHFSTSHQHSKKGLQYYYDSCSSIKNYSQKPQNI